MCERIGTQGGHCESRKPRIAVVFCDVDGKGRRKPQEQFNHLVKAERSYKRQRRNALAGQRFVEYAKAQGAFVPLSSNEVKTLVFGIHTCT